MSIVPAAVLCFLFASTAAAGDAAPAPELVGLEQELTRKLGEPGLDRNSPIYLQFARDFRKRLDGGLERTHSDSINIALHAKIMARLGGAESKQAADTLRAGLEADPADHALRASLAVVEYERENYREAAAAAKALLDPSLNPPPPKDVVDSARALWFLAKDRGDGRAKGDLPPEATRPSASKSESGFEFSSPTGRKTSPEPPSLSGAADPAWEATRRGREMLKKSALGREISSYVGEHGVRYELADLESNVGAQYDGARNVIMVPRNVAELDPLEVAVNIGHEGFHARQVLRDGMIASVEAEQDAKFADRVIYHEILRSGEHALPADHSIHWTYARFSQQVGRQNHSAFNADIKKLYEDEREPVLTRTVEKTPVLVRGILKRALTAIDADFLRGYETLDDQEKKWWNLLERRSIANTRKEHRIEQAWQLKWMKEHQQEFPPADWRR